jgi:hypothetical protein
LKEENLEAQIKLKNTLDLYEEIIDKEIYMAKRSLPLHRKMKNMYRQKRSFQVEIRRLKVELQPFKEKIEKINLDMLAHVDTRGSTMKRLIQDIISTSAPTFFHGLFYTQTYDPEQ